MNLLPLLLVAGALAGGPADLGKASRFAEQGAFEKALAALGRATGDAALAREARTWRVYGDVHRALAAAPDAPDALDALARAIEGYHRALSLEPDGEEAARVNQALDALHQEQLVRALEAQTAGDPVTARAAIERAVAARPDRPLARLQAGSFAQVAGDIPAMIAHFEALVRAPRHPEHAKEWAMISLRTVYVALIVYHQADDPAAAATWAERAVAELPDDAPLAAQHVALRLQLGQVDAAREAVDAALDRFPDAVHVLHMRGRVAEAQGEPDAAAGWYVKTIQRSPDHVPARYDLGTLHFNAATALYERSLDVGADDAMALEEQAEARLREAAPHLQHVVALQPDDLPTWEALATLALRLGDDEAHRRARAKVDALRDP